MFISATYGFKPLYTVPGSLSKDLFSRVGWFIPNVRSGEDSIGLKDLYTSRLFKEY